MLQSSSDIIITGAVLVLTGAADSGNGTPNFGVSIADAGPYSGGIGLSALQAAQVIPQSAAGGAEAECC